ncbi:hypothetical protein BGZ46_010405 [Entomortierella lignicola]|nr:hypothetical protein BGZ46_010405 [Entomortierella lignicola]
MQYESQLRSLLNERYYWNKILEVAKRSSQSNLKGKERDGDGDVKEEEGGGGGAGNVNQYTQPTWDRFKVEDILKRFEISNARIKDLHSQRLRTKRSWAKVCSNERRYIKECETQSELAQPA